MKVSEITGKEPSIACHYGPIGSGKSHFTAVSSAVIFTPSNRISTYRSLQRLGVANPELEIMYRDFDVSVAKSYDTYCDKMDYYLELPPDKLPEFIVIDELDHLRRGAMVKALHINNVDGKSTSLKKAKSGISEGLVMAAIQDYGAEMSLIEQFVCNYAEQCASLGVSFIVNAHERFTYIKGADKQDVLARIGPGFTGKTFPDDVIAVFDNVWRFVRTKSAGKSFTKIDTIGNSQIRAKCCFTGIFKPEEKSRELNDPKKEGITLLDVLSKIQGAVRNPNATYIY